MGVVEISHELLRVAESVPVRGADVRRPAVTQHLENPGPLLGARGERAWLLPLAVAAATEAVHCHLRSILRSLSSREDYYSSVVAEVRRDGGLNLDLLP